MSFDTERLWGSVELVDLIEDGAANGVLTLSDVKGFKVNQEVLLTADTLPNLTLQVKRVISTTKICLGEKGKGIKHRSNLSLYTVSLNSQLRAAEQEKVVIPLVDLQRSVYAEEPVMAYRNLLVDEYGRPFSATNPLTVNMNADLNIGDINVQLTDKESSVGANDYDIVRIGNGTNQLKINLDGSVDSYTLNKLIRVKHDQISIPSKDSNGNPLVVYYKLQNIIVQTLNLSYDGDGDLIDVVVI